VSELTTSVRSHDGRGRPPSGSEITCNQAPE
jgi:hypothetical protein